MPNQNVNEDPKRRQDAKADGTVPSQSDALSVSAITSDAERPMLRAQAEFFVPEDQWVTLETRCQSENVDFKSGDRALIVRDGRVQVLAIDAKAGALCVYTPPQGESCAGSLAPDRAMFYLEPSDLVLWPINISAAPKSEYPRYMHLIPADPSQEEFAKAWLTVFEALPRDCEVLRYSENSGATVRVRLTGKTQYYGGLVEHTDTPSFEESDSGRIYYDGFGCTWDTDDNGVRYHLIDKHTNLPVKFEQVRAIAIITRYLSKGSVGKEFASFRTEGILGK